MKEFLSIDEYFPELRDQIKVFEFGPSLTQQMQQRKITSSLIKLEEIIEEGIQARMNASIERTESHLGIVNTSEKVVLENQTAQFCNLANSSIYNHNKSVTSEKRPSRLDLSQDKASCVPSHLNYSMSVPKERTVDENRILDHILELEQKNHLHHVPAGAAVRNENCAPHDFSTFIKRFNDIDDLTASECPSFQKSTSSLLPNSHMTSISGNANKRKSLHPSSSKVGLMYH